MQGSERSDRELTDTLAYCGDLIPEGSIYRFLAEHRLRVFPDEMFADLFTGRGRPSQPASVMATVLVLQALETISDREAIERLRCDVRWKAAAGLALTDPAFHPSVLTLWRARLRDSDDPERIFNAVRAVVAETGVLARKNRRALDSTLLDDAVATQDTVTQLVAQIRKCRRLIPEAAAVAVIAHDYEARGKPECDWTDPGERADLIDALVDDALAILAAVDGLELDDEQADAVGLLAVVAGQDVEQDPKIPGRWRIVRGVAKDRTISTVDPEARHARKSRSQRRDGYKAHIAAEPDTGIITDAKLTPANVSDAEVGPELVEGEKPGKEILGDSAYASGEALQRLGEQGHPTTIKPIERKPTIAGGFGRDAFKINTRRKAVTCPAGNTVKITPGGTAAFGKLCAGCPLRSRCTTAIAGRTITVDEFEEDRKANKARWADTATQKSYRRHRPMVERSIAWMARGRARRVPYRGVAKNHQWLTTRVAAVNLTRLLNLGLTLDGGSFRVARTR